MKFLSIMFIMVVLYLPYATGKTLHESQDGQSPLTSDTTEDSGKTSDLPQDDRLSDPVPINIGPLRKELKNAMNRNILHNRLSAAAFKKLIKDLGLFTIKDLKMIKASAKLMMKLKKSPNQTIDAYKPPKQIERCVLKQLDESLERLEDDNRHTKRERLLDLCTERYSTMYVLAHPAGLVYTLPNAHCPSAVCHSNSMGRDIGRCLRKVKTIVVYVIDNNYRFRPKTIESGCSCECHHFRFMG